MSDFDQNGPLDLNPTGYRVGQHYMQSFLLAGERFLSSGLSRPDTDEGRFRTFFEALGAPTQTALKQYFSRQRTLTPILRAKTVGLENVRIEAPLVLRNTGPELFLSRDYQHVLELVRQNRVGATGSRTPLFDKQPPVAPDTLRLFLDRLKVEVSQDKTLGFNTTDEISLGIITTDETGDVAHRAVTVGDIGEGKTRGFAAPGLKLYGFDMMEGTSFPKVYTALIIGIERDDGGYNDMLAKAAAYVKDKVTKEMLVRGIDTVGAYFGITVPPEVANFIASILKGFFDSLIDKLSHLLHNDDDIVGSATIRAVIHGLANTWSNGTLVGNPSDSVLSGSGGRYRITTHWEKVHR